MNEEDGAQDTWRKITLSPEEAAEKYREAVAFIHKYYQQEFSLGEFIPVVKEQHDESLRLLQFLVNYTWSYPGVDPNEKVMMVNWAVQAAFWMGYKEGKSPPIVDLPKGFYEALDIL